MCISPVGVVNACNPRAAAAQAYGLAGLIHTYDVGFCQDGAAVMAAAFALGATRDSVVDAAGSLLSAHYLRQPRDHSSDRGVVLAGRG